MREIINGKVYDTEKATLVADDRYWDGRNWDRRGRNTYLYRTPKGQFFLFRTTQWQGERSSIEPISREEAKEWYEQLPEKHLGYEEVFGEVPEEA